MLFYDRKYYLPFVREVPIHLTPIFKNMAESPDYLSAPMITQWKRENGSRSSRDGMFVLIVPV